MGLEWRHDTLGRAIGATGLKLGDLDGDGKGEILFASSERDFLQNRFWYVLEKDAFGSYEHTYVSPYTPSTISCVRLFDYNNDGRPDIVIAAGNNISIYDGPTKILITSITTSAISAIRGLTFENVQDGPASEIIFVDSGYLYIYALNGALLQRVDSMGGLDVAVGNVNADRANEIVVATTLGAGVVLHGRTRATLETFPQGLGSKLRLCDTNLDTIQEVIGIQGNKVSCFKIGISRTPVWQVSFLANLDTIEVGDVEGDGREEILVGEQSPVRMSVLDSMAGSPKWSVTGAIPGGGISNIAIGDVDQNPGKEIVFCAGYSSSSEDHVYVVNPVAQAIVWESLDFSGPYHGMDYGDLDGDGTKELMYAASESRSGHGESLLFTRDAATRDLERLDVILSTNFARNWRAKHYNIDADPQPEIFLTEAGGHDGFIGCYDGLTRVEQYRTAMLDAETVHGLAFADVDNDGQTEIIASSRRESTGATGTYVYIYNAANGSLEWKSESIGVFWGNLDLLRVANVDADSNLEIVVADVKGSLFIFDGLTKELQLATGDLDVTSLTMADLDENGVYEIIFGDLAGNIRILDAGTGGVVGTLGSFGGRIDGLQVKDVAGNSAPDLIFCRNASLFVVFVDGSNVTQTWQANGLYTGAGESDSLIVADIDEDGWEEVLVSDLMGVRLYEIRR